MRKGKGDQGEKKKVKKGGGTSDPLFPFTIFEQRGSQKGGKRGEGGGKRGYRKPSLLRPSSHPDGYGE